MQVYSLSPSSWAWKEHTSEVQGDVPTSRSGHSAVALPGGRYLLLFGGGDATDAIYLSSAHILDTVTWHWSQLSLKVTRISCLRFLQAVDRKLLELPPSQAFAKSLKQPTLAMLCGSVVFVLAAVQNGRGAPKSVDGGVEHVCRGTNVLWAGWAILW